METSVRIRRTEKLYSIAHSLLQEHLLQVRRWWQIFWHLQIRLLSRVRSVRVPAAPALQERMHAQVLSMEQQDGGTSHQEIPAMFAEAGANASSLLSGARTTRHS